MARIAFFRPAAAVAADTGQIGSRLVDDADAGVGPADVQVRGQHAPDVSLRVVDFHGIQVAANNHGLFSQHMSVHVLNFGLIKL